MAGTPGSGLAYRHGSVDGNIIEIESQYNQLVSIKENARDGHLSTDIEFEMPAPDYSAGSNYSPTVIRYR